MKTVSIYGAIGENANIIAYEIESAVKEGEKDVQVRINSGGGSVNDGLSIVSAFNFAREQGAKITTIIDGIAYSMAGYIALCGDVRKCMSYSSGMLHPPYAKGIKNPNKSLVDYIEHKTGNLENLVSAMVDLKVEDLTAFIAEETFMTAEKMKESRFVTEILPNKNINSAKISALYSKGLEDFALVAEIEKIKKEEFINKSNTDTMPENTENLQAILDKQALQDKKIEELEASLKDQQKASEKFEKQAIVASVKNIVATKKLPEGMTEETLVAMAEEMPLNTFEKITLGYPNKAVAVQKDVPTKKKEKGDEPEKNENKSVLDAIIEAGFDSESMMKDSDPQAYAKLVKKHSAEAEKNEADIFAEWKTEKNYK